MTTLNRISNFEKINRFFTALEKSNKSFQQLPQSILASANLTDANNLSELNKTQVYLIVSAFKKNQNSLLLIQTQEQVSDVKALQSKRFDKVFLNGRQKGYHPDQWYNYRTFQVFRGLNLSKVFRTNRDSGLSEYFRNGNFYFPENLGGHKSICPVFFDAQAAETFLYNMQDQAFDLLAGFPQAVFFQKTEKKALLKKITNTRIISLGLGDFLEFYSDESVLKKESFSELQPRFFKERAEFHADAGGIDKILYKHSDISFQKKTLQKIEFLFIPTYEDLEENFSKLSLPLKKKGIVFGNFNSYQEKFLSKKKMSNLKIKKSTILK